MQEAEMGRCSTHYVCDESALSAEVDMLHVIDLPAEETSGETLELAG